MKKKNDLRNLKDERSKRQISKIQNVKWKIVKKTKCLKYRDQMQRSQEWQKHIKHKVSLEISSKGQKVERTKSPKRQKIDGKKCKMVKNKRSRSQRSKWQKDERNKCWNG